MMSVHIYRVVEQLLLSVSFPFILTSLSATFVMADSFVIMEHTFEGQHIREYPKALASSQEDTVWLHARSYIPRAVANGSVKGDLTVICCSANGVPKEACTYLQKTNEPRQP